jgi:hypothetical protein
VSDCAKEKLTERRKNKIIPVQKIRDASLVKK